MPLHARAHYFMGMEILTVNLTGSIRRESLSGRPHFVAPLSLIVPGVINGSKGPLYYSLEEVTRTAQQWDHMPIVVYHPTENGKHLSARTAEVLNKQKIGIVLNSQIQDGKLVAEGWFDIQDTIRVDNRVFSSLENSIPIELSTGLFTDNEHVENGMAADGTQCDFVARNHRPDHLAILPDQRGACSIDDGCGVLVNQENLLGMTGKNENHIHSVNLDENGNGFTSWNDSHFHLVSDFKVRTSDSHRHTLSRTGLVDTGVRRGGVESTLNEGENDMTKLTDDRRKELVDNIVANCGWCENDRETLDSFSDSGLLALNTQVDKDVQREAVVNAASAGFTDQQGNAHRFNSENSQWETKLKVAAPVVPSAPPPTSNVTNTPAAPAAPPAIQVDPPKQKTAEEWFASAPPEIRSAVENAMVIQDKEKNEIIEAIIVNSNVAEDSKQATRDFLAPKSIAELRSIASLVPQPQESTPVTNYFGAVGGGGGGPVRQPSTNALNRGGLSQIDEDDILPLPTINWEEESQKR